jgi:hypothetical protein
LEEVPSSKFQVPSQKSAFDLELETWNLLSEFFDLELGVGVLPGALKFMPDERGGVSFSLRL